MAFLNVAGTQASGPAIGFVAAVALLLSSGTPAFANEEGVEATHESSGGFNLDTQRTWLFRSFLPDESDDADAPGREFDSSWSWGSYDWSGIKEAETIISGTRQPLSTMSGLDRPLRTRIDST